MKLISSEGPYLSEGSLGMTSLHILAVQDLDR